MNNDNNNNRQIKPLEIVNSMEKPGLFDNVNNGQSQKPTKKV